MVVGSWKKAKKRLFQFVLNHSLLKLRHDATKRTRSRSIEDYQQTSYSRFNPTKRRSTHRRDGARMGGRKQELSRKGKGKKVSWVSILSFRLYWCLLRDGSWSIWYPHKLSSSFFFQQNERLYSESDRSDLQKKLPFWPSFFRRLQYQTPARVRYAIDGYLSQCSCNRDIDHRIIHLHWRFMFRTSCVLHQFSQEALHWR